MSRRLLIVTPYFPPDEKSGGAEMFTMTMAEGLAMNHGWDISIVTTAPKKGLRNEVIPNRITVYRLPYRFKLSNSPLSLMWLRELRRIIREVDPDVININLPVPGLGDIASYVSGTAGRHLLSLRLYEKR